MSIVFSSKANSVQGPEAFSANSYYTGYALFWSGLTVGLCNLVCGVAVGINGSGAALADAADGTLQVPPRPPTSTSPRVANAVGRFVKILVIEIFSSVLGLFGLIVGLLVSGKANDFGKN